MCRSPGCSHASTSTLGSVSFSVANIGTRRPLPFAILVQLCNVATTSYSFARSPPMRHSCACCPCSLKYANHLAPCVPSGFCRRWCWQSPCCITGRSSRTLVLMRNSVSSNGAYSGPSFAVSHSPFSSPPNGERRAPTFFKGSHRVAASAKGCFQLACLFLSWRLPTWALSVLGLGNLLVAASPSRLSIASNVSIWSGHSLLLQQVPEFPSPALL